MSTYIGSQKVNNIYLGDKKIKKVYLGTKEVYFSKELFGGTIKTESNAFGYALLNYMDSDYGKDYDTLKFTKFAIPNDLKTNATIVSTDDSPVKLYMYRSQDHYEYGMVLVSPEIDNATIFANEDSSWLFSFDSYSDELRLTLKYIDFTNLDTSKVTNMEFMIALNKIVSITGLENFDTSNVTNMNSVFSYCEGLTSLDLSKWDTSNVIDMSYMFSGCYNLTSTITIMNPNMVAYSGMFDNCSTKSSAKFVVKYINESTKTIATNMVATKSSNSNVFLGTKV